ncbi:MAG: chorismate synthase [Planctomycetota bacterium]|nr:MAG: chorismate synthase [Planctomycetota bacterium]
MANLDYRTAGESHGQAVVVLIEGLPAGLRIDEAAINEALRRRQGGFGRGGRMKIEQDAVNILSGIRGGVSLASPMAIQIANKDWRIDTAPAIHRPRPGHADFAGAMKYLTTDCRGVLERASARETAGRVAAGAVAALLLREFGIEAVGFVTQIGSVRAEVGAALDAAALRAGRDASEVYCPDAGATAAMVEAIKRAKADKDTLGGIVEVRAFGLPPGLGSCMRWQDKLDGRILGAVGSIQAIKGVEIGLGFGCAERPGSRVHDALAYDAGRRGEASLGFVRQTNHAGGLEGGMTNGMPLVVRGAMKPISTLLAGLESVNLSTLLPERSDYERSDICAVPAASVVAEHVVAFELARAVVEKFGGDTLGEARAAWAHYLAAARGQAEGPDKQT